MLSNDGEITLFLSSFILVSTGSALKKEKENVKIISVEA